MPHGWKLCLQAFHPSSLTCGCYGFLCLLGLALLGGQAVHSTKSQSHSFTSIGLLAAVPAISRYLPILSPKPCLLWADRDFCPSTSPVCGIQSLTTHPRTFCICLSQGAPFASPPTDSSSEFTLQSPAFLYNRHSHLFICRAHLNLTTMWPSHFLSWTSFAAGLVPTACFSGNSILSFGDLPPPPPLILSL